MRVTAGRGGPSRPFPRRTRPGLAGLLAAGLVLPPALPLSAQDYLVPHQEAETAGPPVGWIVGGAALAGAFALDAALQDGLRREHGPPSLPARTGHFLGRHEIALPALGLVSGIAHLAGREEMSRDARHIASGVAAAGLANQLLKIVFGRRRPAGDQTTDFRPFNLSGDWQSLPSGHAVIAFALATAINEETDSEWVPWLTYGSATVVGWSRVREDRHWASDVVAGALLGTIVSSRVIRFIHNHGGTHGVRLGVTADGVQVSISVP